MPVRQAKVLTGSLRTYEKLSLTALVKPAPPGPAPCGPTYCRRSAATSNPIPSTFALRDRREGPAPGTRSSFSRRRRIPPLVSHHIMGHQGVFKKNKKFPRHERHSARSGPACVPWKTTLTDEKRRRRKETPPPQLGGRPHRGIAQSDTTRRRFYVLEQHHTEIPQTRTA